MLIEYVVLTILWLDMLLMLIACYLGKMYIRLCLLTIPVYLSYEVTMTFFRDRDDYFILPALIVICIAGAIVFFKNSKLSNKNNINFNDVDPIADWNQQFEDY